MSEIKIGDVIAWPRVQDGMLVRSRASTGMTWWYRRFGDVGDVAGICRAGGDGAFWASAEKLPRDRATWRGWSPDDWQVTIVALGLTGEESAADLQRLAEVFEVREALDVLSDQLPWNNRLNQDIQRYGEQAVAERLHAAKWRPGMSAEDAARLLAGVP